MNIEEVWERVLAIIKELTPDLKFIGINPKVEDVRLSDYNIYVALEVEKWADALKEKTDEYLKTYSRHPSERWELLEKMNVLPQLTEGELLLRHRKEIKHLWRHRPKMLKGK
jgi:hypothetical protein